MNSINKLVGPGIKKILSGIPVFEPPWIFRAMIPWRLAHSTTLVSIELSGRIHGGLTQ